MEPIPASPLSSLVLPPHAVAAPAKAGAAAVFQTNAVLNATVLALADGEVLLDIDGRQVAATTLRSLAPGQQLLLQVRTTTPQVELQILNAPPDALLTLRLPSLLRQDAQPAELARMILNNNDTAQALGLSRQSIQVMGRMQELLQSANPTQALLKEWQNLLGLDLEPLLAAKAPTSPSLKTALLEIVARSAPLERQADKMLPLLDRLLAGTLPFESQEAQAALREALSATFAGKTGDREFSGLEKKLLAALETVVRQNNSPSTNDIPAKIAPQLQELRDLLSELKAIATQSTHLLQKIETFQLLQLRFDQEASFFLPFFLSFLNEGYLLVEGRESNKPQDDQDSMRLSLFLAVQGLGDMRIDLFRNKEGVSIRFLMDSRDKAAFVSGFQDDLKQAFTDTPILGLSFDTGAQPPQQTLIRRAFATDTSRNLLDSRV